MTIQQHTGRCGLFAATATMVLLTTGQVTRAQDVDPTAFIGAWTERQKIADVVTCTVASVETIVAGTRQGFPKEDESFESETVWLIDFRNGRLRSDHRGMRMGPEGALNPIHEIYIFDGDKTVKYRPGTSSENEDNLRPSVSEAGGGFVKHILLAMSPVFWSLGVVDFNQAYRRHSVSESLPGTLSHNERGGMTLRNKVRRRTTRLELDPERAFAVVRFHSARDPLTHDGVTYPMAPTTMDIEYEKHSGGWLASAWQYDNPGTRRSVRVTNWDFSDSVDEEMFDEPGGARYVGAKVVRKGRRLQQYDENMNLSPVREDPVRRSSRGWYATTILGLIVVAITGTIWWKRDAA